MPDALLAVLGAMFGLLWGSFVGVLVVRVPVGADAVRGRSRCDSCGTVLAPRDLIPVVSWVLLRGRCRHCAASISPRWTVIEICCGATFALVAVVVRDPWQVVLLAPFSAVLIALALIDLEQRRLPNAIVYPATIAAAAWILIVRTLGGSLSPVGGVIGLASYGGAMLLIAVVSRGGMGGGDIKLAGLIGLVIGAVNLPSVGVAAAAAILSGGIVGIVALLRGADRRSALPFGPMLALGGIVAALGGGPVAEAYLGLFR